MKARNKGMNLMASIMILLVVFISIGTGIKLTVLKSGDSIRMKHISNIGMSIRANSLGKSGTSQFFYPTSLSLLNALKKTHFDIPDPYENICYFIGTVQNYEKNSSDYIIITWGEETSTLEPDVPGVLFETSSDFIKRVIKTITPTLDADHFRCKKNPSIPWKNDMSPLLDLNLFPTHWLKINEKQQVCIGITTEEIPDGMARCLPDAK